MRFARLTVFVWPLLAVVILASGCGQGAKKPESHEGKHEESPSGASFKPGRGILLTDETRKILNVEIADVTEEKLPQVIRFNVQVFDDTHRFANPEVDHSSCDLHGSGFLPPDQAALIGSKQPVQLKAGDQTFDGFVVSVQKTLTHGDNEIIVGITSVDAKIQDGEFVVAAVTLPRETPVTMIPRSALLKTAEGAFVYAVNGTAYYRTAVKTGSEGEGRIEIMGGLYPGDQVVTTPVETLWLIELRATKGGGHSH